MTFRPLPFLLLAATLILSTLTWTACTQGTADPAPDDAVVAADASKEPVEPRVRGTVKPATADDAGCLTLRFRPCAGPKLHR